MRTFFKHEMTGRAESKRLSAAAKEKQWQATRKAVLVRDRYTCQVCGSRDKLDVHHIRLRSAGGTDTTDNLVVLCRLDHEALHLHKLHISGNADKRLRIETL